MEGILEDLGRLGMGYSSQRERGEQSRRAWKVSCAGPHTEHTDKHTSLASALDSRRQ